MAQFWGPHSSQFMYHQLQKHKLSYHIKADDIQIYASFTLVNKAVVFSAVQECVSDIKEWMQANRLKLNDNKSEAIILG